LAKNIALDEISTWRPNWDYLAWKKIYYGGFANKEVDDYNNGRGSERQKSLHRKSKKEHRKSKTSLLDQNVESLTSTVIKIKNYLWRFHPMSLG
jgi:hypothetical protein